MKFERRISERRLERYRLRRRRRLTPNRTVQRSHPDGNIKPPTQTPKHFWLPPIPVHLAGELQSAGQRAPVRWSESSTPPGRRAPVRWSENCSSPVRGILLSSQRKLFSWSEKKFFPVREIIGGIIDCLWRWFRASWLLHKTCGFALSILLNRHLAWQSFECSEYLASIVITRKEINHYICNVKRRF